MTNRELRRQHRRECTFTTAKTDANGNIRITRHSRVSYREWARKMWNLDFAAFGEEPSPKLRQILGLAS